MMRFLHLPLTLIRLLGDVRAFLLRLTWTALLRVFRLRSPIRNWPRFVASLWWYVRGTRKEEREAQAMGAK